MFFFMVGLIISIVFSVIIITLFLISIRRHRRRAQEIALSTKPVTIKPNGNGYLHDQGYSQSPNRLQIQHTMNTNQLAAQNVQIPTPITPNKLEAPANHHITPLVEPIHTPEPMPSVPERPQLPPAKVDEKTAMDTENQLEAQPNPQKDSNFRFTPKQPTLASEPETETTTKNGPTVHLPDNN
jgi:hypothetical protein